MKKDLPGWMWISQAVIGTIVLGSVDWIAGYDLNLCVFSFLPVSLAAWHVGRGASARLSVLALSVALFLVVVGCTTVSYIPTQEGAPKMSYSEARQRLMAIKESQFFTNDNFYNIADVAISSDGIDVLYKTRNFLQMETGETVKQSFSFESLAPNVSKAGNVGFFIAAAGAKENRFYFKNETEAVAVANALFVLKHHAGDPSPPSEAPSDAAAEAAFQEEARTYRDLPVKPVLPEAARKYAVQGDVAVEKKNLPAAADRYADALQIAPWWPEGHFQRGVILAETGRYAEGIAEMKKFLRLAPDAKEARTAQDNIYKWESAGALAGGKTASGPVSADARGATSPDGTKVFVGKVEGFAPTNPLWYGDIWCRIEVVADTGARAEFYVSKTTRIADANGKTISAIKRQKRAEVTYSLITGGSSRANGKNGAISLRYLE